MANQSRPPQESRGGAEPAAERTAFRRWQRARLNVPVRLIITREDNTRIAEARVNDLSAGGMLIYAGTELRSGDKTVVEFTPPYSSTPVRAPGIVRHRRGYSYGVEFQAGTTSDREDTGKFRNLLQLAAGVTAE